MKKVLISVLFAILLCPVPALAHDVILQWFAAPGATGYKISMTADGGSTWAEKDAGNTLSTCGPGMGTATSCGNYIWTGVPDTGLILFKVGPYNANGSLYTPSVGAWYNGSWSLPGSGGGLSSK